MSVTDDDPRIVKEAVDSEDGKLWKEAMVDEMAFLHKNEAWDLVELPARRKPIGSKWVFKKKTNAEGKVEKYKARLVAKGYSQVPGLEFYSKRAYCGDYTGYAESSFWFGNLDVWAILFLSEKMYDNP